MAAVLHRPWVLAITLMFAVAVALYLGRRRLAAVMVISPPVGIALAQVLKQLFGRHSGGSLAYPSGHTTASVIVMGLIVLLAGTASAVLVAVELDTRQSRMRRRSQCWLTWPYDRDARS